MGECVVVWLCTFTFVWRSDLFTLASRLNSHPLASVAGPALPGGTHSIWSGRGHTGFSSADTLPPTITTTTIFAHRDTQLIVACAVCIRILVDLLVV